jgi:hypothetical protein
MLIPFRLKTFVSVWTDSRARVHEPDIVEAQVIDIEITDGVYSYHQTHIPGLTAEDVYARLNDQNETPWSLDALGFAVLNNPEIESPSALLNAINAEISRRMGY